MSRCPWDIQMVFFFSPFKVVVAWRAPGLFFFIYLFGWFFEASQPTLADDSGRES